MSWVFRNIVCYDGLDGLLLYYFLLLVLPIYAAGIVRVGFFFVYFACKNFSIENCGEVGKLLNLPRLLINKIEIETYHVQTILNSFVVKSPLDLRPQLRESTLGEIRKYKKEVQSEQKM